MGAGNAKYDGFHDNSPQPSWAKLTKFSRCSSFRLRERGPLWGLETTKPSATNTGLSQSKEIRMWTHIVSLLDSLAQTVVVWNGDINVNVSGGSVDWIGLSVVMILLCAIVRKR